VNGLESVESFISVSAADRIADVLLPTYRSKLAPPLGPEGVSVPPQFPGPAWSAYGAVLAFCSSFNDRSRYHGRRSIIAGGTFP
jgi:hypothetical protein